MKLIPLTKGYFAKVDDEDFERLSAYRWTALISKNSPHCPYAISYGLRDDGTCGTIYMHKKVFNAGDKVELDHIDRDSLNNQRENLRLASKVQNAQNRRIRKHSTPYKGVHLRKSYRKYIAYIQINKKFKYLGVFTDAKEAARTYDREALAAFGEFALTNQQMGVL